MPESVRLCPFHMPFGILHNLTGDLLAYPTIDKWSLHNSYKESLLLGMENGAFYVKIIFIMG